MSRTPSIAQLRQMPRSAALAALDQRERDLTDDLEDNRTDYGNPNRARRHRDLQRRLQVVGRHRQAI